LVAQTLHRQPSAETARACQIYPRAAHGDQRRAVPAQLGYRTTAGRPWRLVQARAQLHTGRQIRHLSSNDGKLRPARVVGMHGDHVSVQHPADTKAFKVHFAAIHTEPGDASTEGHGRLGEMERTMPSPPPKVPVRAKFRVGNRVTFTDKNLQHRVGLIVRVNQRTATLDGDGQQGCVGFELLRHLVGV
jgi:hypothetical protein